MLAEASVPQIGSRFVDSVDAHVHTVASQGWEIVRTPDQRGPFARFSRRKRGLIVRPCTRIEKTTTPKVKSSMRLRSGKLLSRLSQIDVTPVNRKTKEND